MTLWKSLRGRFVVEDLERWSSRKMIGRVPRVLVLDFTESQEQNDASQENDLCSSGFDFFFSLFAPPSTVVSDSRNKTIAQKR